LRILGKAERGSMLDWLLEDGKVVLLAIAILLAEIAFLRLVARDARIGFLANVVAGLALLGGSIRR